MLMSERKEDVPRTDICRYCDRQIIPEVEKITGQHEIIHAARNVDLGVENVAGGTVEVVFCCGCSSCTVEYGAGSTMAAEVPDEWLWECETDATSNTNTDG
jgi:hypothetical protein